MADDSIWMQAALALAERGRGTTRPNPPVGAVVVKRGRIIGSGYHRKAGGPHAEVLALREAGKAAFGADLYVTLEPCSSFGRTAPCTDLILETGIKRVIVSVTDPDPRHNGRGLRKLRRAGLQVKAGVCKKEGESLLAPFAKRIGERLPFITLKLGMTLDGRIADSKGNSQWITSPASRKQVHALRRKVDAVMVGAGTAVKDNPSLLPKSGRKSLRRIVVDSRGRTPLQSKLFTDGKQDQTIMASTSKMPMSVRAGIEGSGSELWILPQRGGRVSLRKVAGKIVEHGYMHVLCEGGGMLAGSLLKAGLVDELLLFIAPSVLGADAHAAIDGVGWPLSGMPGFEIVETKMLGPDCMIRAEYNKGRGGSA